MRGATSIHWVKNDIALREGADQGRVQGVSTPELTFTHMIGRDAGAKVWCIATNKWGKVESRRVTLRIKQEDGDHYRPQLARQNVGSMKGSMKANTDDDAKKSHMQSFGGSLKRLTIFNRTADGGVQHAASMRPSESSYRSLRIDSIKETAEAAPAADNGDEGRDRGRSVATSQMMSGSL